MVTHIDLNDWDKEQIEKNGYVKYMHYVVMTDEKFKELTEEFNE